MVVFVCFFVYHTMTINFPRSSSHSYKLPEKILAKIFRNQKNPKIVNFKPKKKPFAHPRHLKYGDPPPPGLFLTSLIHEVTSLRYNIVTGKF